MMMAMYAAVFALAIMGVNDTTYLIRKRLAAAIAVCPIGEDCDKVLTSKQKNILVLPLDIWGLLFYSAVAFSCALAAIGVGPAAFWDSLVGSIVGLGAVLSLFFTYLQWRVIKVWCFWCLTSAFTVWTMGVLSQIFWSRHEDVRDMIPQNQKILRPRLAPSHYVFRILTQAK